MMDDTVILATSRDKCIRKFEVLLEFCREYGMKINASKTKFLVICGEKSEYEPIRVDDVTIYSCDVYMYLGSPFTIQATMKSIIHAHAKERRRSVVKFISFISRNPKLPFHLKKKVAEAAVMSSIFYASESWMLDGFKEINTLYMDVIKALLGVRVQTPGDLCVIEAGFPTCSEIITRSQRRWLQKCSQHKPYLFALSFCHKAKTPMWKYIDRVSNINAVVDDSDILRQSVRTRNGTKFRTYLKINPELNPTDWSQHKIPEYLRIAYTRFRLSSHNLRVETGRWARVPPENRVCVCDNSSVQDEQHVIEKCILLDDIRTKFPGLEYSICGFMNCDRLSICRFIFEAMERFDL